MSKLHLMLTILAITLGACGELKSEKERETRAVDAASREGGNMSTSMPLPSMQGDESDDKSEFGEAPNENDFLSVLANPLSTFSSDVDTASYTLARKTLRERRIPGKSSIRTEEFINYFEYDYPQPTGEDKIAIHTSSFKAPWNEEHVLIRIGLKAKEVLADETKPMNLVFLVDVSGSMAGPNRLGLVQASLKLLVEKLTENDRVGIVTYAAAGKIALEPVSGSEKEKILAAINGLESGGGTNGAEGIKTAYQLAQRHYIEGGVNRVILATDGDLNLGVTSPAELTALIKENANESIYLSAIGFGMGNYKDDRLERLSGDANGNYAYIDSKAEAQRVFGGHGLSTLVTVAKDTKIQIEFNPRLVAKYRLVGYEDRKLKDTEFNDDARDAGDMGSGHRVTALYEVIPKTEDVVELSDYKVPEGVDPLIYRTGNQLLARASTSEWMSIKVRYKDPEGTSSKLIQAAISSAIVEPSTDDQFAGAVAIFAQMLRGSKYTLGISFDTVASIASKSLGSDMAGERKEFVELVRLAEELRKEEMNGKPRTQP